MWAHGDVKWIFMGMVGILCFLGSMLVVVPVWVQFWPASTVDWVLAGLGMVLFAASTVNAMHTERRVAVYQQRRNQQASSIRDQVIAGNNPVRPYFVYLRPFDIDGKFVEAPRQGADLAYVEQYGWPTVSHDLESALALLVYPYGDLVALSDDPGKAGAGYVRSTDLSWQAEVEALCRYAEGIFMVPFDFQGTAWEVEMLSQHSWLDKTLLVMPATPPTQRVFGIALFSRDYRTLWTAGRARYPALELPEYNPRGAVIQAGSNRRVFEGFGRSPVSFDPDTKNRAKRGLEELRSWVAELSAGNKP